MVTLGLRDTQLKSVRNRHRGLIPQLSTFQLHFRSPSAVPPTLPPRLVPDAILINHSMWQRPAPDVVICPIDDSVLTCLTWSYASHASHAPASKNSKHVLFVSVAADFGVNSWVHGREAKAARDLCKPTKNEYLHPYRSFSVSHWKKKFSAVYSKKLSFSGTWACRICGQAARGASPLRPSGEVSPPSPQDTSEWTKTQVGAAAPGLDGGSPWRCFPFGESETCKDHHFFGPSETVGSPTRLTWSQMARGWNSCSHSSSKMRGFPTCQELDSLWKMPSSNGWCGFPYWIMKEICKG